MLDATMVKFAEPIGPGQIVDRESLVTLPSGYAKVMMSKAGSEISVRVLTFQEKYNTKSSTFKTSIKVYLAIGQQVIEAEERSIHGHEDNDVSVAKKLVHVLDKSKLKADSESSEVLQVCLFSAISGRGKDPLGMIHIAFGEIYRMLPVQSNKFVTSAWYKVFPNSSFVAGFPVIDLIPHGVNRCTKPRDYKSFQFRVMNSENSPRFYSMSFDGNGNDKSPRNSTLSTQQYNRSKSLIRLKRYTSSIGTFMKLMHRGKNETSNISSSYNLSSSFDAGNDSSGSSGNSSPRRPSKADESHNNTKPSRRESFTQSRLVRTLSVVTRRNKSSRSARRSFSLSTNSKSMNPIKQTYRRSEEVISTSPVFQELSPIFSPINRGSFVFTPVDSYENGGMTAQLRHVSASSDCIREANDRRIAYKNSVSARQSSVESGCSGGGQSMSDNSSGIHSLTWSDKPTATPRKSRSKCKLLKTKLPSSEKSKGKLSFRNLASPAVVPPVPTYTEASEREDNVYAVLLSLKNMSNRDLSLTTGRVQTSGGKQDILSNSSCTLSSCSTNSVGGTTGRAKVDIRSRSAPVEAVTCKRKENSLDKNGNLLVKHQARGRRLIKQKSKCLRDNKLAQRLRHVSANSPHITVDCPSDHSDRSDNSNSSPTIRRATSAKEVRSFSPSPDLLRPHVGHYRSNSLKSESDEEYHTCSSERHSFCDLTVFS